MKTAEEIAEGLTLSNYDDASGELLTLVIEAVNEARLGMVPKPSPIGEETHSFVFRAEGGVTVAWFEDPQHARAYSARMNKEHGKGTHDWAHTFIRPAEQFDWS